VISVIFKPMDLSLNLSNILALLTAMAVLAAVPSVSVLAVTARSASSGFTHGALTAAGIVLGDIIFILVAIFGLMLLVEALGPAFILVKYAGAAYLVWLSVLTWRARASQALPPEQTASSSKLSSLITGLLITLGDQKAVFFYFGFFPAFINLALLTWPDILVIMLITVMAVGGVKLMYAYVAVNAGRLLGDRFSLTLNTLAAGVMLLAAIWIVVWA